MSFEGQFRHALKRLAATVKDADADKWGLKTEQWAVTTEMARTDRCGWRALVRGSRQHEDDWGYLASDYDYREDGYDTVGEVERFECEECGLRGLSKIQLRLHRYREHMEVAPFKLWLEGTQCPVCGGEYHERSRVYRHLRFDAPRCRRALEEEIAMHEPPASALQA